jgi:hypothetical protein
MSRKVEDAHYLIYERCANARTAIVFSADCQGSGSHWVVEVQMTPEHAINGPCESPQV